MRLKSANSARDNVGEKDIEEFFAEEKLREEFIILSQNDENLYLQAAGEGDENYVLEYRGGSEEQHFRASTLLSKNDVKEAFLDYLQGGTQWRERWTWERPFEDRSAGWFGGVFEKQFSWNRFSNWLRSGRED